MAAIASKEETTNNEISEREGRIQELNTLILELETATEAVEKNGELVATENAENGDEGDINNSLELEEEIIIN